MAFKVHTTVPNLGAEMQKIDKYNGKMVLAVEKAISKGCKRVADGARSRVPRRSGKLRNSIKSKYVRYDNYGFVAAYMPHAHLIELGVKKVTAKPKKAKAMAIDEFGIRTYRQKVNIPARRARPFLKPAFEAEGPNIVSDVAKAVNDP